MMLIRVLTYACKYMIYNVLMYVIVTFSGFMTYFSYFFVSLHVENVTLTHIVCLPSLVCSLQSYWG